VTDGRSPVCAAPVSEPTTSTSTKLTSVRKTVARPTRRPKDPGHPSSWEQFANLVLTDTRERYIVQPPPTAGQAKKLFCDIPRGTYLVRGENVLLLGEVDLDRDDEPPPGCEEADAELVFRLHRQAEAERKRRERRRQSAVARAWGGEPEGIGEVLY